MAQLYQGFVTSGQRTVSPLAWPLGLHGTIVGTFSVTQQTDTEHDKVNRRQILPW